MNGTTTGGYESPFHGSTLSFQAADISSILTIAFFIIFVVWVINTAVVSYHWFRYGHRSWMAVPAIAINIFVSGLLIFYIASGVS